MSRHGLLGSGCSGAVLLAAAASATTTSASPPAALRFAGLDCRFHHRLGRNRPVLIIGNRGGSLSVDGRHGFSFELGCVTADSTSATSTLAPRPDLALRR